MCIETGIWTNSFSTGKTYCLQFPGQLCPWTRTVCRALCSGQLPGSRLHHSVWVCGPAPAGMCSVQPARRCVRQPWWRSRIRLTCKWKCSLFWSHLTRWWKEQLNKWLTFYREVKSLPQPGFLLFQNFFEKKKILGYFCSFFSISDNLPLIRSED